MYIPFESTFLRLLQVPLSLLSSHGSAQDAVLCDDGRYDHPQSHQDLYSLGILTPYRNASAIPGVLAELPDDCTVDQVILLHRHGSRGPSVEVEQEYIGHLMETLKRAKSTIDAIPVIDLLQEFRFLHDYHPCELVPQVLTSVGRKQLFDHGVEFRRRYKDSSITTDHIVSTTVPRVIDSARFFAQGFFGSAVDKVTFETVGDMIDADTVSWLRPWKACPKLTNYDDVLEDAIRLWVNEYIPPIVDKFNRTIPNVFSADDIHGALYRCAYELAARNKSPWCELLKDDLQGLEHELDLLFDRYTGYIVLGDPGPVVGAFYVKKLIERLTEGTERLYLDFAHDSTILFALSTMGLNKDVVFLDSAPLVSDRKFKTTEQAPFAANMIWERFSCETSFQGTREPQVRLVLNGVTFPLSTLPHCQSEEDRKYGTCSLANFVSANKFSTDREYKDALWNAACEDDA